MLWCHHMPTTVGMMVHLVSEVERSTGDMFAAIRYYRAEPPSIDEVIQRVQQDFVPVIRDMAGFVSYFVLVPGGGEAGILSVSVFEDQQSAERRNRKAPAGLAQNLGELLRPTPEFADGRVVGYGAAR